MIRHSLQEQKGSRRASRSNRWYRGAVQQRLIPLSLVVCISLATVLPAQEEAQSRIVFSGQNERGELWANIGLTIQRLDEDYIPMVVMIVNHEPEPVLIDRDAIRLVGPDGKRYPMPTLKELRKNYNRIGLDARSVSGAGIPYEVWQRDRRLLDSNFFPNTLTDRRATVIDEITLPTGYALIDVVYFARPKSLVRGTSFLLEVHGLGWDGPVRLGITLN